MSSPPISRSNATILCIDDNRFGLAIRKLLLETRGFQVLTASSGQAGLAMLNMFSVDAVLLDYRMDGIDGEAVATRVRGKHPNLPIILLSGYPSEIPERLLRTVDAFLVKGQPVDALFTALEAVTGMRPEKAKPATDWADALEAKRLVKVGRELIAKNRRELGTRKLTG
jgi:CheY-like chemotaxis protein